MSIDSDRAGPRTRQPVPEFLVLLAVPAVVSATVGFAASYVAMRHYLDDLGWLSYLAPAVIELTIGYLAVSLVYRARRGGRWRPERLLVYAGIALAAYLNWGAYPNASTSTRAWHAAMPLLWSIAIEWGIAWARHLLKMEQPPPEHVPLGVWITRPRFAWSVQRFMWLTGTRTYTEALARHLAHALAVAEHAGAGPAELAAIRLRYAVVRPSAAALTAGDGNPSTTHPQHPQERPQQHPREQSEEHAGERFEERPEERPENTPENSPGGRLENTPTARSGNGSAEQPGNTVHPTARNARRAVAETGTGRGAGLPDGIDSGRDLTPEQVADLIRQGRAGVPDPSVRQVMHAFAIAYDKAARALELAKTPRLRAVNGPTPR
ncbi:hypothetical protein LI90_3803 [Carbonactinospora thermoautotrophica]|uniref:DUF2637 domain-containing protein n=1 Tax=Carbonactinospora thermoautotrophica TaxID=1469144 RepID=A0A132MY59_9ACTN|nr:DUF2637 domain-containing protein [Carbonactinospora thermoautotrophica]KWX02757.1 hypothetical protein LI90_3803 [Carbonactinospora thermoautotrophica]